MKCHYSLLEDFKNGDIEELKMGIMGTFFKKGEQILLLLGNFHKKIGRKLIISSLLNASKT